MPTYNIPMMYKRDVDSGEVLGFPGDEYYDNSVPFEGVYLDYVKSLQGVSDGDIQNITLTHRSRGGSLVHPYSSYTAAVQDVADGLVDMAVGPFWITGARLKLTSFTIPFVTDKNYLVIPKPGTKEELSDQVKRVLAPFSTQLWVLVVLIIIFASLLGVWFSDLGERNVNASNGRPSLQQTRDRIKRNKGAYARLTLDSFLQKGMYFFSAGVDADPGASLPYKFLMFGFGFFILITVSAYVANLAAFLTRSMTSAPTTMDAVITSGYTICAHPVMKQELQNAWPTANFYFTETGRDFHGMLEDFDANKCKVLVVSWEDTSMDSTFTAKLCERDLVFTQSVIIDMPMAFPINSRLISSFSYWMYEAAKYHEVSIPNAKAKFSEGESCNIHLSQQDATTGAQIQVQNMFLPLMVFFACVVVAIILQLVYHYNIRKGKTSNMGRVSTLNLMSNSKSKNRQSTAFRRKSNRGFASSKLSSFAKRHRSEIVATSPSHDDGADAEAISLGLATNFDEEDNVVIPMESRANGVHRRKTNGTEEEKQEVSIESEEE